MIDKILKAKETVTFLVDNFMETNSDLVGFRKFVAVKGDEGIFIPEDMISVLKQDKTAVIFQVVCTRNVVTFTII